MNRYGRTALVIGLVFVAGLLAGSRLQAAEQKKATVQLTAGEIVKIPLKRVHTAMTGDVGMKALVFRIHKTVEPERIPSE